MIVLTLAEVADLTGGRLAGGADGAVPVTGDVVTDSRQAAPGCLFVALPGTRADGHDHAPQARTAGAVAVLAGRDVGGPAVLVDDPLAALGRLARGVVDRIPGLVVVGVTGSSGKTGTKDLIAAVLAGAGPTVATAGSYNNELGLPLTALRCTVGTRFLVVEMGARMPGNISYLCGITPPRIAVVLNVGAAHLGVFGSLDVTARTKGELVAALPDGGVAVLNADDERVRAMPVPAGARTVRYGRPSDGPDAPEVTARDVRLDAAARPRFRLLTPSGAAEVALALHGEHHVTNALAAAAVGLEAGLDVGRIARSLTGATAASRARMEVTTRPDGVTVVNDAYNANPDSMRAALRALAAMGAGRRTWAVVGEMLETGDRAAQLHGEVGALAVRLGISRLMVVGEPAGEWVSAGAAAAGMATTDVTRVPDVEAGLAVLTPAVRPGDVVLAKASRAVGLDVLASRLLQARPDGGAAVRPPEAVVDQDVPGVVVHREARR
ncbi:MAG TPA: UDP-N-acetylmuramoyl-tripeptide--D-alanyl-D-alanine ligase [Kineosporiaceae bacterium]